MEAYFGSFEIISHRSHSEGAGTTALSRSFISIVNDRNDRFEGTGLDQDIEISAMKALIDALNRNYIDVHFSTSKASEYSTIDSTRHTRLLPPG